MEAVIESQTFKLSVMNGYFAMHCSHQKKYQDDRVELISTSAAPSTNVRLTTNNFGLARPFHNVMMFQLPA